MEVSEADNQVDVFFVDYGYSEWVGRDGVMPMPVVLRRVPFQAIECSCLDMESVGLEWSGDVCDVFFDSWFNKHFTAQVSQIIPIVE